MSSQAFANDPEFGHDTARMEELARDLDGPEGTPNALMRDHMEALRFYLLGNMPQEYNNTLQLARDLLPLMEDKDLKRRVGDFLETQPKSHS